MIYLIGGPPKCGKTTLAKAMSKELYIPWISADTLQNIVWAYTSDEKRTDLFPHKHLRGENNDDSYAEHSTETIIKSYIEQSKASYDAIAMMAETYLVDKDDFIVEGYQVTPEIVDHIHQKYGKEHVRAVFLVRNDARQFVEDIYKSATPNDWIIRRTKNESTYPKIAKMVVEYSDYFQKEAKKYDLPVFQMDKDFDNQISELVQSSKNDNR
jgi:2-phosphoglycerate kinase